jgi:hypothetical protein
MPGAQALGIRAVFIHPDDGSESENSAEATMSSVAELPALIASWNQGYDDKAHTRL